MVSSTTDHIVLVQNSLENRRSTMLVATSLFKNLLFNWNFWKWL